MWVSVKGDVCKSEFAQKLVSAKVVGVKNIVKDSIKEYLCKSCEDDEGRANKQGSNLRRSNL